MEWPLSTPSAGCDLPDRPVSTTRTVDEAIDTEQTHFDFMLGTNRRGALNPVGTDDYVTAELA
jgi:hypothetical protein